MCETDKNPGTSWRTVSLVTSLRHLLARNQEADNTSQESRADALRAIASELTRRGIDADSLIRYGLCIEVFSPLLGAAILKNIIPKKDLGRILGLSPEDLEAWRDVLDIQASVAPAPGDDDFAGFVQVTIESFGPRVITWILYAPVDDLITLRPPQPAELEEALNFADPSAELIKEYRWVVDRFSETFVRDWSEHSLRQEYLWIQGRALPPCPPALMGDRLVTRSELEAEIARRAVLPPTEPSPLESVDSGGRLVIEMENHARLLLSEGRYREAAALFEFAEKRRPEDPSIHNDMGFCLIPVNSREALKHLNSAAALGYHPAAINTYNIMCCQFDGRDFHSLVGTAGKYWDTQLENRATPGTLWRWSSRDSWQLVNTKDARKAIATLAHQVCTTEGWKELEQLWFDRLEELA
ncbi:tetratricopeptide (TPR) repeat protein [Streptacidiphilus sp. MAP12-33]|uniref:hypothetical protein n=1 Tax=Streptacidiphilus sp. MAP12-33 TaxID=3156266 RepID=UPI003519412E